MAYKLESGYSQSNSIKNLQVTEMHKNIGALPTTYQGEYYQLDSPNPQVREPHRSK
jgi:hypothetical protein